MLFNNVLSTALIIWLSNDRERNTEKKTTETVMKGDEYVCLNVLIKYITEEILKKTCFHSIY